MIGVEFAEALRESSPQYALLVACRQMREWIDLPDAERARRVKRVLSSEQQTLALMKAKSLVWGRLSRELAAPDGDAMRALGALDARTASGVSTAEDQEYIRRVLALLAINAFLVERYPAAAKALAPDPQLDEIVAMVPALEAAIHGCDVNVATADAIAALQAEIERFARRADRWSPPIHVNHAWWLGTAEYTVGRAALETGEADLARQAFERGIAHYERARDWKSADDLRRRVLAIHRGTMGDVDAMLAESLQALLVPQDAMRRYGALAALATAYRHSGDRFEYARIAEQLANELIAAGYADPEVETAVAVDGWIAAALELPSGNDLLEQITAVGGYWVVVMGARATDHTSDGALIDPVGAARAESCVQAIGVAVSALADAKAAVGAELEEQLAEWYDPAIRPAYDAAVVPDASHGVGAAASRNAVTGVAINTALYALRLACNEQPSEEQLAEAIALVGRARALGSRIHEVQALLEQAYVLLALKRYDEVATVTHHALRVLSKAHEPSLALFALSHERELYLTAKQFEARALVALRSHGPLLELCRAVIGEIEQPRARVTAPYQQSAFMATRAEFYEYCAAAAYKLGQHDLLLGTTERLKASSAWKLGRVALDGLSSEMAAKVAALDEQYRDVNRALAVGDASGAALDELLELRRRIGTARAIARGSSPQRAPDEITIGAVQGALGEDEAALSWFWVSEELLLVLAFTDSRFETFPIEFSTDARRLFDRWVVSLTEPPVAGVGGLASELDALVDALAPTLFPTDVREFIRGKARLVLSPHRALHLFPFHAIRVSDNAERPWLIQHVAIRYAPNLTSLTLEWHGNREGAVLAIGINDFGATGFPPLGDAVREATEVARAHGELGQFPTSVTRAAFMSLPLPTYRCLHLATHGTSVLTGNAQNDPLDCGIAFADGLMDGWQLGALDLRAELVVLASCYSGQRAVGGRGLANLPGDDILGLQAVLFEAGAGTVLGALWPVDDENTRAILVDFHGHYAGGADPDRALQAALLTYLNNPFRRHGRFDWAPFFLTSARNPRRTTRPV